MKHVLLSLLCLVLMAGCDDKPHSTGETLILGTSADNPPYEFFSSAENRINGFDVELAEIIAKELGVNIEVKDMDFNALIPAVSSGRIDMAMASITPTNERKKSVAFSQIYYQTQASILVRKGENIRSTEDFKNKKIGAQMGTSHEIFLKEVHKKTGDFEILSRNKTNELVQELKNGRLDAVLIGSMPASEYAKGEPDLISILIPSSIVSYAIALKKGSSRLDEVNRIIEKLRRAGEISRLEKKWVKPE